MKVLIVGPYEPDGQYSIPAFVSTLKDGLQQLGVEVETCAPPETRLGKAIRPIVGKRTSFIDKFLIFPSRLRKLAKQFDCVHIAEHGYAPYVRQLQGIPHIVTCHDLIVAKAARGELSDWPLSNMAMRYQESILHGLARADQVATVSEMTQEDVLRLTKRPKDRTPIVYDGFYRQVSRIHDDRAKSLLSSFSLPTDQPWLMHIGGDQPNKNKAGVARIFGEIQRLNPDLKLSLVFAGTPPDIALQQVISTLPNPSTVHFVIKPSDEQVIALYSLAKALIFPSLYEGFGLPIIEAQACGTPVITSNRAPMTEVGGGAAIYVDPESPVSAAQIVLDELPTIQDRIPQGFENIRRFESLKMCEAYADIYSNLVSR